jgi:hypothetical protein
LRKEGQHIRLVGQIQLRMGAGNNLAWQNALRQQCAHDRAAHHATVTSNIYLLVLQNSNLPLYRPVKFLLPDLRHVHKAILALAL